MYAIESSPHNVSRLAPISSISCETHVLDLIQTNLLILGDHLRTDLHTRTAGGNRCPTLSMGNGVAVPSLAAASPSEHAHCKRHCAGHYCQSNGHSNGGDKDSESESDFMCWGIRSSCVQFPKLEQVANYMVFVYYYNKLKTT